MRRSDRGSEGRGGRKLTPARRARGGGLDAVGLGRRPSITILTDWLHTIGNVRNVAGNIAGESCAADAAACRIMSPGDRGEARALSGKHHERPRRLRHDDLGTTRLGRLQLGTGVGVVRIPVKVVAGQ